MRDKVERIMASAKEINDAMDKIPMIPAPEFGEPWSIRWSSSPMSHIITVVDCKGDDVRLDEYTDLETFESELVQRKVEVDRFNACASFKNPAALPGLIEYLPEIIEILRNGAKTMRILKADYYSSEVLFVAGHRLQDIIDKIQERQVAGGDE